MKTAKRLSTIAGTLVLATACAMGTRVTPSASGMGIRARAQSGESRLGELLAIPDSGVVFLDNNDRVVFTRFAAGIEVSNSQRSPKISFRGRPDRDDLFQLRFHSRYPIGLTDDALARLLAAFDQREAEVWP